VIDNDIRTYLLTQSPITSIVGSDATGSPARISPSDRREGITADSIVYERVATDHEHNLTAAQGYSTAIFEFDCISTSKAGAKALGEALRGEMDGFRGTMGSTTVTGVLMEDEHDDFDPPADGSAKGIYHVVQTYSVSYFESIPTF